MHPWFKSKKGIALLIVLAIVALSAVFYLLQSAPLGIPPDWVETIVICHEDEPSFSLSSTSGEGRRLLSKCEDVLFNLTSLVSWIPYDEQVAGIKERCIYVEIIFKENYDVPIHSFPPQHKQVPANRVLFVLSGEDKGSVLFRAPGPTFPIDNLTFIWSAYKVSSEDHVGWPIFQELIDTVNETQPP